MTRWMFIAGVVALAVTFPAAAQQAVPVSAREGFWIGFGLGGGSNLTEGFEGIRGGGAGFIRLGGTVTPQLLIGGEGLSWARSENNSTSSQGNVAAVVYFYPSATGGLFLKSGLGFASRVWRLEFGNTTTTTTETGFGATFGGGLDIQLGNNFYLTPNLDFLVQTIEGTTGGLILFTIGATWH